MSETGYLSLDGENVVLLENDKEMGRIPLHNLEEIVSFGYRGTSPALMGACAERNVSLCYLTPQGKLFWQGLLGKSKEMWSCADSNMTVAWIKKRQWIYPETVY